MRFPQGGWGGWAIARAPSSQMGVTRDRGERLDQASCLGFTIVAIGIKISHNLIGDQIPQGVENKQLGIPAKIAISKWQNYIF